MKKVLIWIAAILLTLAAAYYQRTTGPTYPRNEDVQVGDSTYTIKLIRTSGPRPARIKLPVQDTTFRAQLSYKRLGVEEEWTRVPFEWKEIRYHSRFMRNVMGKEDETAWVAYIPQQPPAGKVQYYLTLSNGAESVDLAREEPVVIRFKGNVPAGVLIPHVIAMFMAMLIATIAGLYALFGIERYKRNTIWAFVILFIGGFILGPWVQWHAFGDWWTGIPFGWDLTDNKTLFAFIFWVIAMIWGIRGKGRPWLIVLAAVMTLVIFSIPHSLFGSTLDYSTGSVMQG